MLAAGRSAAADTGARVMLLAGMQPGAATTENSVELP